MNKEIEKRVKMIMVIVIIILIILVILYVVDKSRMKNNKSVLFSTWGYDYVPPEIVYPNESNNDSNMQQYYFYGKVVEYNSNSIIVEPNEGENERKSSDKISIGLGKYNNVIYHIGTQVKITYSGYIMETYPAQIQASKIELVSKLELMYETIIDDIIKEDEPLNFGAQYISLDIDSFAAPVERGKGNIHSKYLELQESEKETLLRYCKKYNSEIKDYSFQELKDNGFFDEEKMMLDGILISIDRVEKITENSAIIKVRKYRSGLGAIYPEYKLTYKNGIWNIEVVAMAIS